MARGKIPSKEVKESGVKEDTEQCEVQTLFCKVGGLDQPVLSCYGDDPDIDLKFDAEKLRAIQNHGTDCSFRIEVRKNAERKIA